MSDQPQEILLQPRNSIEILVKYLEIAQQKGAYESNEIVLLNRACAVVLGGHSDEAIDLVKGKELLIQGILKGQSKGVYALGDAALLHTVVQYVVSTMQEPCCVDAVTTVPTQTLPTIHEHPEECELDNLE
jgi:hypothetical protein